MAETRITDPVLLVVASFSRHAQTLEWARQKLQSVFGPIAMTSPTYQFTQTAYYEPSMGPGLRKHFHVFHNLVAAEYLADAKLLTNALEVELQRSAVYPEERPLNLDPGILTLGKFMLATTKDQAHRIYLRNGIFAEVTLRYEAGAFCIWPWTYADYRQMEVLGFLNEAREFYRQKLKELRSKQNGS